MHRKSVDHEPVSGFKKPVDIVDDGMFTDFTPVPSRGFCQLTRAKRHGRWWMLKGLKEPYRHDTTYLTLLKKEFEIASQLQHPMVVSVYSLEEVEGFGLCVVMEWIEGITLKEWLAREKHAKQQRRHVADMLMDALAYIHSRRTQHRDLKPSNIMLTHDGQYLKLIDFGLSDTDSHTILKTTAGTEGYLAPEGSSDIFALGRVLRELHLGWASQLVTRKCVAPLAHRYNDVLSVQRDLHYCWLWPRRLFVIICLIVLVAGLYLTNRSHTQQALQTTSNSLKVLQDDYAAKIHAEKIKSDSLQQQINQINEQQQLEQKAKRDAEERLREGKRQIDRQLQAYGIQQMLDTVSCQINVSIPFNRILNELIEKTEEQELKDYINEKYYKPWVEQMSELPFD